MRTVERELHCQQTRCRLLQGLGCSVDPSNIDNELDILNDVGLKGKLGPIF